MERRERTEDGAEVQNRTRESDGLGHDEPVCGMTAIVPMVKRGSTRKEDTMR